MFKHSLKHCRKVANVAFNDLPSSRSGGGHYSCDVCTKNGVFLQVATVYCTVCSLMYCAEHEKVGVLFVWLSIVAMSKPDIVFLDCEKALLR